MSGRRLAGRLGEGIRGTWLVTRREVAATFESPIAVVHAIAFIGLANSIFMNDFFLAGHADMTAWFERAPLLMAVFLPAVSMRTWAEERRQRTMELLLTLPITPTQAVLGKYAATLFQLAVLLAGALPIAVMLAVLGDPDLGRVLAGFTGTFLLGAFLLALGGLLSALARDQVVAFVLTAAVALLLVLAGQPAVVAVLDGLAPALTPGSWLRDHVSVLPHHEAFVRGVVPAGAIVWLVGLAAACAWTTRLVVEHDRS